MSKRLVALRQGEGQALWACALGAHEPGREGAPNQGRTLTTPREVHGNQR